MRTTVTLLCLLSVGILLTGCVDINADASDLGGGGVREQAPPPDPAADPRSVADLQRENAQLRQSLAQLEKNRQGWQGAIDRQKDEIDALKDRRDDLEKQRDRAKKALKDDD